MRNIKIIFIILILNTIAFSQTYQTMYNAVTQITKFQNHKYNFNPKKLLFFQLISLGANSCNPADTINGNTFIIDPVS